MFPFSVLRSSSFAFRAPVLGPQAPRSHDGRTLRTTLPVVVPSYTVDATIDANEAKGKVRQGKNATLIFPLHSVPLLALLALLCPGGNGLGKVYNIRCHKVRPD